MFTYLKAQAAALTGSAVDFLSTFLLVSGLHAWYITGTITGNILGGITQFSLGRNWAFSAQNEDIRPMIVRYIIVWAGNIALSAAGVYLLTQYFGLNYILSKLIVSLLLGLTYNYILQKNYVFK